MARKFNGTTDGLTTANHTALSGADAFTVMVAYKPVTATPASNQTLVQNGTTGGFWLFVHRTTGHVRFQAQGFSTTYDMGVSGTDWQFFVLRHKAAGELAWFGTGGTKVVLEASLAESIAALASNALYVGYNGGSSRTDGTLGDVAAWNAALSDDICRELAKGVSPRHFPTGQQMHYALNGNHSPERDWLAGKTLTVTGTTQADHPPRIPWRHRTRVEPCWVVNVTHDASTVRAATRDLYDEIDYDVLGAAYPARITADMTIIESLPEGGGVVDFGQAVLQVSTADGGFSASEDYQGDGVEIFKYDRVSHALTSVFVGYVDHQQETGPQGLRLDLRSDDPHLRTPIPRLSVEYRDDGSSDGLTNTTTSSLAPSNTSAPYPIACGDGGMAVPPALRYVEDNPPGEELVVAWGNNTTIKGAWADVDPKQPGLEKLTLWTADIPGSPTRTSNTTFTVTMGETDFESWFRTGYEVRWSTNDGDTWGEAVITGVSWSGGTGTVTVFPAILGNPLVTSPRAEDGTDNLFEISTELIVNTTAWQYVSGVTTPLTTAIVPTTTGGSIGRPLLQLSTTDRANPADLIKFIIEDDDQGLGGTLNVVDHFVAYFQFAAIPALATCIKTVLGGDGTTRPAYQWLNDIAMIRGCRLWRDELGEWRLKVDTQPQAANLLSLGYGANTSVNQENNLLAPPVYDKIPRSQQTSVLKLLYAAGGRARGSEPFLQSDFAFRTRMNIHPGGREQRIPTTLLRDHDAAATVTWYVGKRLEHGVNRAGYVVDHDAWRVRVGELVTDVAKATNYRVIRKQQTLTTYTLACEGYNSEIFTTNLTTIRGEVDQPILSVNPDDREIHSSLGGNLIVNPDFSTGIHGDPSTLSGIQPDGDILPGWILGIYASDFDSITVEDDLNTVGGQYLQVTTKSTFDSDPDPPFMVTGRNILAPSEGALQVKEGDLLILSVYVNTTATAGAWTGIEMRIPWFNSSGTLISSTALDLKLLPGDRNSKGWRRVWGLLRAPANAARATALVRFLLTSTTYQFDAFQLERNLSLFPRPSNWQPYGRTGIQPNQIKQGSQTIRPEGATLAGLTFSPMTTADYATGGVTLTGTSTTLLTWPGGYWTDCAGRITGTVTLSAGTTWDIREGSTSGRLLATAIATTGTFDIAKTAIANPVYIPASTAIVAVPTTNPGTATFSGGAKVKLAAVPFKTEVPEV